MVVKCALVALVLPLRIPMEATVTKSKSEKNKEIRKQKRRNIKTKKMKKICKSKVCW